MASQIEKFGDEKAKVLPFRPAAGGSRSGPRPYQDVADIIYTLNPDFPVYCFNRRQLELQMNRFGTGFPGEVAYAVKANPTPLVITALAAHGMRIFDVASLDEIELVRDVAPQATLLYDNPVKSRAEIGRAYAEFGVRSFAVDDEAELHKINAVIGADANVQISVRFKLDVPSAVLDLGTKFGATERAAVQLLRKAAGMGYQPALTFHPGSQCTSPASYTRYIEAAARISADAGIEIGMLNVGGGFPVPYANAVTPALAEYFRAVGQAFRRHFNGGRCRLLCEPGRALVAPAVSLLCRVKHRRSDHTIFLNDGIYGGLLEQFMFKVEMPIRVYRDGFHLGGPSADFSAFGPTCDSTDRLPFALHLPDAIDEGDWIEFGLMGAYASATSTHFNGYSSEHYVEVLNGFQE
ncbi:MAG: type III PLP-dependent enzyme [Gammaproteobacteria bacterium]|nr:type III PLP-dependent enzyme [Gammaproteobacteria bacterium]